MVALPAYVDKFLDACPDPIVVTDSSGNIVHINPALELLFGYTPASLLQKNVQVLWPDHVQDASLATQSTVTDIDACCMNGSRFHAKHYGCRVVTDADEFLCHTLVKSDDAIQPGIEDLSRLGELDAEALRAKSAFIAAAAHDLRQPLQTLQLLNATLQRKISDTSVLKALREEQTKIESLSDLLNALLNINKLESETVNIDRQPVSISNLFDDLYLQFEAQAHDKGLALTFAVDHDLVITTDRELLFDLLQNLLTNAIRYTDYGSVELRCRNDAKGGVIIEVIDTGIGIPSDLQQRIWEDFYQVAIPYRGGNGLGLGIVKRLARLLGARVTVDSVVGRGTAFTIELQGVRASMTMTPATTSVNDASVNDTTRHRGERIIIVEDNDAIRAAASTYLELDGYAVNAAGSLSEMDDLLQTLATPPAMVISDFRLLGGELGSSAISKVRTRYGEILPAIVLTGDTTLVPESLKNNARTRVLSKPINVHLLTATINELLDLQ